MIMESARCIRLLVGFPLQFWNDVVDTVIYLISRGPSSTLDGVIPEETWTGKKLNYLFMIMFGYQNIDKENRTKLEDKSKKCSFSGYRVDDFGYFLWE